MNSRQRKRLRDLNYTAGGGELSKDAPNALAATGGEMPGEGGLLSNRDDAELGKDIKLIGKALREGWNLDKVLIDQAILLSMATITMDLEVSDKVRIQAARAYAVVRGLDYKTERPNDDDNPRDALQGKSVKEVVGTLSDEQLRVLAAIDVESLPVEATDGVSE